MNTLIVLLGPTGVGKTALSIEIAEKLESPIISADSRQLYKDLIIGTAAPDSTQLSRIKHHMVGFLELTDYYSASQFEEEVLSLLKDIFQNRQIAILSGGSMLYLDAICKGIDEMPTVTKEIRDELWKQYEKEGLQPILEELRIKDPQHFQEVDHFNYKRVIHAVEMCRMTNKPYSTFRTRQAKTRPFQIVKIGLARPREELYDRINQRVIQMVESGFIEEARNVFPYRQYNSLNTVGYKELFQFFDGELTLEQAVEKIQRNTRVYARKQMTWFKRDNSIHWFHPDDKTAINTFIENIGG